MEKYTAKHDAIVKRAIKAAKNVDVNDIVEAFVGSLTTKNLAARSAFGSYVVLQHLKPHKHTSTKHFDTEDCAYCGLSKSRNLVQTDDRVEEYPFQVQHAEIGYSAFDLSTFKKRIVDTPSEADCEMLRAIFSALKKLPKKSQLVELNKSLQGVFKSNKDQRMIMLETFGYAGISAHLIKLITLIVSLRMTKRMRLLRRGTRWNGNTRLGFGLERLVSTRK